MVNRIAASAEAGQRAGAHALGCDFYVRAWCLPPASAARRARSLLRDCLRRHLSDEELIHDLEAVVDELAANAWQHACGPCEMRVAWHQGIPVLCEITDAGDSASELTKRLRQAADLTTDPSGTDIGALLEGGRGLAIVARLTNGRCGARQAHLLSTGQQGTSVWFALPVSRPASKPPQPPGCHEGTMDAPGELTGEDVAREFLDWWRSSPRTRHPQPRRGGRPPNRRSGRTGRPGPGSRRFSTPVPAHLST